MANPDHERLLWQVHRNEQRNVDMRGFDLSRISVPSGRLEGVLLAQANLEKSNLSGAYLKDSNLTGAQLRKSRIVLGDLRNADLSGADLTGCDLTRAVLCGAKLANANLTQAKLVKTKVDNVDFTGTNLDKADMRGIIGLTEHQLASARNADKLILDERMSAILGRKTDQNVSRHGRPNRKRTNRHVVDLLFKGAKPGFGDLFLICGCSHPEFAATGEYGFSKLADLNFEQVDDYFAICERGDPVVWLFPLIKGSVVEHHPGPLDGIRVELADNRYEQIWTSCISRLRDVLHHAAKE